MFFILSKILGILFHPFNWAIILFLIAWLTKRPGLKKWTLRSGIAIFIFFTNTFIFCEFVRLWEPRGKTIAEVGHYDVAIVLGGMAQYDNNHKRLSIRRGADRIWQTLHLYQLGKVDKILIAGANGDVIDHGLNEAMQFREVLVDLGVPRSDILVDSVSQNTYQNAIESKKVLDRHPELESVLLVTSALHMPRAEACFREAGFENMDTFTTDHYTGEKRGYTFDQFFLPDISTMSSWSMFLHELAGYVIYAMMGYL